MAVGVFRLTDGSDIITQWERKSDDEPYHFIHPMTIRMVQSEEGYPIVTLTRITSFAKEHHLYIKERDVLAHYEPVAEFIYYYGLIRDQYTPIFDEKLKDTLNNNAAALMHSVNLYKEQELEDAMAEANTAGVSLN